MIRARSRGERRSTRPRDDPWVPDPDDERLAHSLRAIRRRLALRQVDLAEQAGVRRRDVMLLEGGDAGLVPFGRTRRVFDALGGRARIAVWWRGAAADRLLDERHAALVDRVVRSLAASRWNPHVEVSFAKFGERGSIDVLGLRPQVLGAAVFEIKGSIGSIEEMNRSLDAKLRLAPGIVEERFGWRPELVAKVLVLPADRTVRRIVDRHAATMQAAYPARTVEVRRWLRKPSGNLRGLWFLSEVRDTDSDDATAAYRVTQVPLPRG